MEIFEIQEVHETGTVTPPIVTAVAVKKGNKSTYALKWALDQLMSPGQTLILLHVRRRLLTIPTPMGNRVPITHVQEDAVAAYMREVESQTNALLSPFRRLCNAQKVNTVLAVAEEDDVASAIIQQISSYGIQTLVMGSSSTNGIISSYLHSSSSLSLSRRIKAPHVPATVAKNAPTFCAVYAISKGKLISVRSATCTQQKTDNLEDSNYPLNGFSDRTGRAESESETSVQQCSERLPLQRNESPSNINEVMRSHSVLNSATAVSIVENPNSGSISVGQTSTECDTYYTITSQFSNTEVARTNTQEIPSMESDTYYTCTSQFSVDNPIGDDLISGTLLAEPAVFSESLRGGHENVNIRNDNGIPEREISSLDFRRASASNNEPFLQWEHRIMLELGRLKLELKHTQGMFAVEREEAMKAKITADELSLQVMEDVRKVEEAKKREEIARTIAAEEKVKSEMAIRMAEKARQLAEKEAQERRDAELRATIEAAERKKAQEELESTHQGYRYTRYPIEEIQTATNFFSDSLKIGEGGYGAVYMCNLQHTTVAVKIIKNEATQGIQEFQRELEILSRVRHPHMVLLLGACPDHGCLVYEYMANGSLEDRLLCKGNSAPLPWFLRFRIIWEVASALLYLHSSKPEPIVHRDLKPANILLDDNFVSKIGDAGLAKLVPAMTTNMVTQYNETVPAGTFCYIDPEYQRTGSLGPKSDLYALGIIILQVLTGKPPMAITEAVEIAIERRSLEQILDENAGDWPLNEALELATLGLKCAEFRRRDRPNLENDVLPKLERFKALAVAQTRHVREEIRVMPPHHFLCPILQEIMVDPHIAADGFTYEHSNIKAWLENNNTSPMTNEPLDHDKLIPNHALKSAILEWKIKFGSNHSDL
eukprot:PITA_27562